MTAISIKRKSLVILIAPVLAACIIVSGIGAGTLFGRKSAHPQDRISNFPMIVLWAWERPEDLSFIDPDEIGVAFLAGTIRLQGDDVLIRPRLQPLTMPDNTSLMAVVRIESDRSEPPSLSSGQRTETMLTIYKWADIPGISGVQIDFDAKVSERPFYRNLLFDLRRKLSDPMALSITALASWCIYDNWLSGLPIDEAVPMLFRMGTDGQQVFLYLERGGDFRPAVCRSSLGISTDEPIPALPPRRRVYVFHAEAWSPESVRDIIEEVRSWQ